MLTVQASPAHTLAGLTRTPHDAWAAKMARVPIAALLQNTEDQVEKFTENGRTYYTYRNDMYLFPTDDTEAERLDIMHHLIYVTALNNNLHVATLRVKPRRMLDIGFGTGFWMMEMAKQHPAAEIIGLDLDNPTNAPSTGLMKFRSPVDFNTSTWPIDNSSVDLVHMAQLCGCVRDWQEQYRKAFRSLRPGSGQIEHIEIDWTPRSHAEFPDEAMSFWNWWGWMKQASSKAGKPVEYREDTEQLLEQAGFVEISHRSIRVPLYTTGKKDVQEWSLAHNYQMAMGYVGSQSFTGFSMALFTRYMNLTPSQVEEICESVLMVNRRKGLPLFVYLHVWTARRPMS